ncbi:anaerobic ribonucleoside-triphosphate reductase [Candidatus Woesearchaeota archaeon]|nr:anaerobic ribonucleoside-triphosphate reductase [Candidatus Woesearchaeota archaeon]
MSNYRYIKKRDGKIVSFDVSRISDAIFRAARSVGGEDRKLSDEIAQKVADDIFDNFDKNIPTIDDVLDAIEKVLIETGHAKTSKAFILYREKRNRTRKKLAVRKKIQGKTNSTDLSLMVAPTSKDELREWSKDEIVQALEEEADLSRELAEKIATNVEDKIIDSGVKVISTSLIRELVDNELFEMGLNLKLEKQAIIGMPIFDLNQLIFSKTNENSNVAANNPEAVNLAIAENTLKQYALKYIFSKEIAEAHLKGTVHLHDLGYPIRVYCSAHSLDYIKKYGLQLLNLSTTSKPAKHAQTLTGHLNTFLASMQAYYAGALGISYINIAYAPLLVGLDYNRLKQEAQYLIFSCSQNAFSRGGQTLFIDFNIHLGIPSYLKQVPAIGPKGKYMLRHIDGRIEELEEAPRDENDDVIQPDSGRILTYGDFEKEAQAFAKVLMDVWREGDARGQVFPFPKMDLHLNEDSFSDPTQLKLLNYACQIASENGSPYFVFDRDEVTLSACCRLRTKVEDTYVLKHPESMRFCGFQNVTINLPQAAYRAGKEPKPEDVIKELDRAMDIAIKAHLQKKEFISRIMDSPGKPLWQVGMQSPDGKPYIELDDATYIIGLVGLNECVRYITGKDLHENEEAYKTGLKIVSSMYLKAKKSGEEHGLKFTLEESPAESASLRLAKVDMREYPESREYVRGDIEKGQVYYTNSIHLVPDADVDIIERIEKQSKFNQLIESGAITHVFVGEKRPSPDAILELVKKTWENTQTAQITISPEFTVCEDCNRVSPGYLREETSEVLEEVKKK